MADLSQSSSTAVHAVGRARAAADDVREAANSCKLSSLRDEGHSIALKAQEILSHIEERVGVADVRWVCARALGLLASWCKHTVSAAEGFVCTGSRHQQPACVFLRRHNPLRAIPSVSVVSSPTGALWCWTASPSRCPAGARGSGPSAGAQEAVCKCRFLLTEAVWTGNGLMQRRAGRGDSTSVFPCSSLTHACFNTRVSTYPLAPSDRRAGW